MPAGRPDFKILCKLGLRPQFLPRSNSGHLIRKCVDDQTKTSRFSTCLIYQVSTLYCRCWSVCLVLYCGIVSGMATVKTIVPVPVRMPIIYCPRAAFHWARTAASVAACCSGWSARDTSVRVSCRWKYWRGGRGFPLVWKVRMSGRMREWGKSGSWTCNQQIWLPAAALPSSDPGQVVHTCPTPLTLRPYEAIDIWLSKSFRWSGKNDVEYSHCARNIIIIVKHVLIKVTLSCQRHCRGTAQSLTNKKNRQKRW